MSARKTLAALLFSLCPVVALAAPPVKPSACQAVVMEGELAAGHPFSQPIGGGLKVYFQALPSGWLLRIVPATGPTGDHDYAELATPPYQSVTPLAISTDFAFRAQDAIGWNPRRFRFATSAAGFRKLEEVYVRFVAAGLTPPENLQVELAQQIAQTSEATFTIVDSRLVPGNADQWKMAAAVAQHFTSTAHILVPQADDASSALGRIVWLRFRLELDIPRGFKVNPVLPVSTRSCDGL